MELERHEIHRRLRERDFCIEEKELVNMITDAFRITRRLTNNDDFFSYIPDNANHNMNPMLWEYGHFLGFWENLIIKNLNGDLDILNDYTFIFNPDIYDSFKLSKSNRYKYYSKLLNLETLKTSMSKIEELVLSVIKSNYCKENIYLAYLGMAHQHMHNESFIFSLNQQGNDTVNFSNNYDYSEEAEPLEWVDIPGGSFHQGAPSPCDYFFFDNESPRFETHIDDFTVSKNMITNHQFIWFINCGGYTKQELYTPEGWAFIQNNNLKMPKHFSYENDQFYETLFGQKIEVRLNHPAMVTWYEADAYCKMFGYKMLAEREWEYLADSNARATFDYTEAVSVKLDKNVNRHGVKGLYGNYWEWCEDPIYPYDGFVIDPVYREMSYPFFGFKKICRGGAWCVPKFLATRTYRNAQLPDCYYQFISFRVKRN